MDVTRLLPALVTGLAELPACKGIFLSGSHARGTNDPFSDLDLVLVVDPADHPVVKDQAHALIDPLSPLVMFRTFPGQATTLINAVTATWDRIDLLLEAPDRFVRRPAQGLRPLDDPTGLAASLSAASDDPASTKRRILQTTEDFLRILGLLSVGLGRGEYVLCTMGAGHLRDHLITLMKAEAGTLGEGALHLSRSVSPADMAILTAIPMPPADRDSIVAAHMALAQAFIPRARAFHARHALTWPEAFEAATRAHLADTLGRSGEGLW
jgi:hypothetical protein